MSIPSQPLAENTNTAGSKDLTFGNTDPKTGDAIFYDVEGICATRPDGVIITVGTTYVDNVPNIALVKTTNAGETDPNHRITLIPMVSRVVLFNLTLQPDGKALLLFSQRDTQTATIMRFNEDGTVDTAFGINGETSLSKPIYGGLLPRSSLTLQNDGKILTAFSDNAHSYIFQLDTHGTPINFGKPEPITLESTTITCLITSVSGFVAGGYRGNDAIVRGYDAQGRLDSGFGVEGETVLAFPNGEQNLIVLAIAPGPQGLIGVVGSSRSFPEREWNFITSLRSDGTPSQAFNQGKAIVTDGDIGAYIDLVFQSDGKMVALAREDAKGSKVHLVRHSLAGPLDQTFGVQGIAQAYIDPQSRPVSSYVNKLECVLPGDKLQSSGALYVYGYFIGRLLSE
ncbi:delta-60 repeat domain-containing protein [Pseudomonas sp. R5-89-07]|uniref:delta-60 repeat domain-containing protein n=1 Tax=Pseudomonas sp. R5-89-07 TaxID=658644 RepID=UPI000F572C16|nr:delta-60 repeat domain-containing protein [Pseudomonas sp. R5-89-07]AZF06950.1 hypothetical protein C4J94_4209 [Pseudomonas sp. R5-89-07]